MSTIQSAPLRRAKGGLLSLKRKSTEQAGWGRVDLGGADMDSGGADMDSGDIAAIMRRVREFDPTPGMRIVMAEVGLLEARPHTRVAHIGDDCAPWSRFRQRGTPGRQTGAGKSAPSPTKMRTAPRPGLGRQRPHAVCERVNSAAEDHTYHAEAGAAHHGVDVHIVSW